jgi:hypothetical protein
LLAEHTLEQCDYLCAVLDDEDSGGVYGGKHSGPS